MWSKSKLIKIFKMLGSLQINLNDVEKIGVEQCIDYLTAEKIVYNNTTKCCELEEYYGTFENIEDLFEMLEKRGILRFEKED